MLKVTTGNRYQMICIPADGSRWYFQHSFADLADALQQAKLWTASADLSGTYYISVCDPLSAMTQQDPPAAYTP